MGAEHFELPFNTQLGEQRANSASVQSAAATLIATHRRTNVSVFVRHYVGQGVE
ncbi:MAG: hypothetical protein ACI9W2_001342 [Gammaproteobacteria bacterium]|jgi:hypothetical protein